MARAMTVTFRRVGRGCAWDALRPPRTRVGGPTMAAGGDLPHDLATFVIERELGIEHGFWGCVAEGATFRTLRRRRTPQGLAVIARHRDELDAAESRVNAAYAAWRSRLRSEQAAPPDPTVSAALDVAFAAWRALADGGSLTVEWTATGRPRRR